MKKIRIVILAIVLTGFFTACHFGRRHTTIVENTDNNYIKIEYAGSIYFNSDGTSINSISPGGYIKYQNNDKKLEAKNNRMGGIRYELFDGDQKLNLAVNGRRFIADAVKVMIKKNGRNYNWR
jgi:hypothetical protein